MSYTALYRKWRPASFDEVKGQDHIVKTLKNQITSGRIGHAYLLCGTRGTGKTSIAKIFARAVNCEHPTDGNPCGECALCKQIAAGASLNVVEIDAASNNGVENIRDIREQVQYPPTEGRFRVFIIDEVHMLSIGAFNALLKTLEEPPSYVIFILATTEAHKIPITILSRCQRYDFKRITVPEITARLQELTQAEQMQAEERALRYVARAADGSMRDALSLLDQCSAFHFGEILTYEHVLEVLGAVDNRILGRLFKAAASGDAGSCVSVIEEMVIQGRDLGQMVNDFVWYLRNLLIVMAAEDAEDMLDMSAENIAALREEAMQTTGETLMRYIRIFSELSGQLRYASQKRVLVEIAFIKLTMPSMEQNTDSLLQRISALEKKLEDLSLHPPAFPAPASEEGCAQALKEPGAGDIRGAQTAPEKPVVLPRAEYDDLMLIRGEWAKITRLTNGAVRAALKNTAVEPGGGGCLCIVFTLPGNYSIVNRESVLKELKQIVEETYQKTIEFKARLESSGELKDTAYVSDEDLKVIHEDIVIEDD